MREPEEILYSIITLTCANSNWNRLCCDGCVLVLSYQIFDYSTTWIDWLRTRNKLFQVNLITVFVTELYLIYLYFIQMFRYVRLAKQPRFMNLSFGWTFFSFYFAWYFFISCGIILVSHIHLARLLLFYVFLFFFFFFINNSRLAVASLPKFLVNGKTFYDVVSCLYSNLIHWNRFNQLIRTCVPNLCVAFFYRANRSTLKSKCSRF